jgi:hypothetical protein
MQKRHPALHEPRNNGGSLLFQYCCNLLQLQPAEDRDNENCRKGENESKAYLNIIFISCGKCAEFPHVFDPGASPWRAVYPTVWPYFLLLP